MSRSKTQRVTDRNDEVLDTVERLCPREQAGIPEPQLPVMDVENQASLGDEARENEDFKSAATHYENAADGCRYPICKVQFLELAVWCYKQIV